MITFPYKVLDLTHTLHAEIPTWNLNCGYECSLKYDYSDFDGDDDVFRVNQINIQAGIGTHIDSPAHCIPGGKSVEQLDLNDLVVPGCMIDVSAIADESYSVSVSDVLAFEASHGDIAKGSFVIFYTGWSKYWSKPQQYHNEHQFPSISAEVAQLLLSRDIAGVGIDTLSPDRPKDGFVVHRILLGAGKYIVENVANAEQLAPSGFYAMVLPIKSQGATESPIRLIALKPVGSL